MHPSLSALCAYRQFVVYKIVPRAGHTGKMDKLPCDYRTGKVRVDAHDSQFWTDHDTASVTAEAWGSEYGVGFVFTESDPFWFLDIDGAYVNGQWSALAQQLCALFAGCAIEISQSGTGLHIFGSGPVPTHSNVNKGYGLEFYSARRFAALTGNGAIGDVSHDASAVMPAFVAQFFQPSAVVADNGWSDGPCEDWLGPTDDADLIRRALRSRSSGSAFGGKAGFADLWEANVSALAATWPDPSGNREYDASSADAALAQHLSFWTGRDCERIERLMRQSKLVRDKWERDDYMRRTILGAVSRGSDVLQDKPSALTVSVTSVSEVTAIAVGTGRIGNGWKTSQEQLDHFTGCFYVRDLHKAFVPGGHLLKPEQFKVQFGGYQFNLDNENGKTTRDAWEAFTQSLVNSCPTVDGTCFKPNVPAGATVEVSGQIFVNTYVPVQIVRTPGDASPFLSHLRKVLPVGRDADILLAYMAACVQHQGEKFQWAPLLQGVEGNGKTLFSRCVAEAIGRRYVHFPPANEISEKFNSWLFDTIFVGVEDIYVPNQKQEVIEILKPMITSNYMAKRAMQTDQQMREVIANFIFNSNHRDALRKTQNDRRFAPLFCAQQKAEDLARDGMTGDYFPNLYKWLREGGYAIVNDYLFTYVIPAELNPAGDCQRAPMTSSTADAVSASAGTLEQEIQEAIEQGLQGFAGGWVSSMALDKLIDRMRMAGKISYHKRKDILDQMGYVWHPALHNGRVNNAVMPDNGKTRLYVRKDSMLLQIDTPSGVAHAYSESNKISMEVTSYQRFGG